METPQKFSRNRQLENVAILSTPVKIPASPMLRTLGYGTGVNVYCLERSPRFGKARSPWAIKRMSRVGRSTNRNDCEMRLREEATILRKLNHPNIIGFKGFKIADDGVESLVLECCEASLGEILENRLENTLGPLEATLILKMCGDISKALDYLHNEARLLHGDIKSHNILVKGNFEICKLCDFGVSLPLDENMMVDFEKHPNLEYVGTQLWSAPEVIDDEKIICHKADIFSFGLVVYETISLIPPHTWILQKENDEDGLDDSMLDDDSLLVNEMDQVIGTRPPLPLDSSLSTEYNKVVEIFYICTNELPEDRPSAKTLSEVLSSENIEQNNLKKGS